MQPKAISKKNLRRFAPEFCLNQFFAPKMTVFLRFFSRFFFEGAFKRRACICTVVPKPPISFLRPTMCAVNFDVALRGKFRRGLDIFFFFRFWWAQILTQVWRWAPKLVFFKSPYNILQKRSAGHFGQIYTQTEIWGPQVGPVEGLEGPFTGWGG